VANSLSHSINFNTNIEVEEYVFFYLYTKENPDGQPIILNNPEDQLSNFDTKRHTKILTHGYFSSKDAKSSKIIRDGNYLIYLL
jgi:hypothetical protein